jgi:MFS family permease
VDVGAVDLGEASTGRQSRLRSFGRETFQSLRTRNFRLFFIGQLVSNSGNWLTMVALTLLVLHLTDSGLLVGLLAACQFGPMLLLSPFAGLIADRSNKRRLLYVTQTGEMAQSFALAALAFMHDPPLVALFAVALAGGCLLAFDNPARRSFVTQMVSTDDVPNAVTLYSALVNTSRIFGPTLAGALVVTVGFGWCFTIDGISYVAVLLALAMMREAELRPIPVTPRGKRQVREGIRYVRGVTELRVSFLMLAVIGTLSYNFSVVFPLFVERTLGGGDAQYTLVYAVFSAGSLVGALAVARRRVIDLRLIVIGAALFGVSMIGLGLVPSVAIAFPVVAIVGVSSVSYMTATTALVQVRAEPTMHGRALALQSALLIGTTPLGGPLLGALADAHGARLSVFVGAAAALGAAALGWRSCITAAEGTAAPSR